LSDAQCASDLGMLRAVTVQDTQLALLHAVLGEVWGRLYRPRVQSSPGQAAAGHAPAGGCRLGVVLAGS
jgi:hypothetical protein